MHKTFYILGEYMKQNNDDCTNMTGKCWKEAKKKKKKKEHSKHLTVANIVK